MKPPTRRSARVGATVRNALAEVLREGLADPRLAQAALVSISSVVVSPDLGTATVYLAALADSTEARDEVIDVLQSAAGFLRGEVARRVSLKRVPSLRFAIDPAILQGRQIEAILREIGDDDPDDTPGGQEPSGD